MYLDYTRHDLTAEEAHLFAAKYDFTRAAHKTELRFRALAMPATIDLRAKSVTLHRTTVEIAVEVNYRLVDDASSSAGSFTFSLVRNTITLAVRDMIAGLFEAIAADRKMLAVALGIASSEVRA